MISSITSRQSGGPGIRMSDSAHRQQPNDPDPDKDEAPSEAMSRRERREASGDIPAQRLTPLPFLIVGAALLIVTGITLWWFFIGPGSGEDVSREWVEDPGPGGVHAREVPPEDWESGFCLKNFEDEQSPADVIDCAGEYDAQLLLRTQLEADSYPGAEDVAAQAARVCEDEVEINQEAVDEADYDLALNQWYPTESSWEQGDRQVDCMLVRADENSLSGDFLGDGEGSEDDGDSGTDENSEDDDDPSEGADDDQ